MRMTRNHVDNQVAIVNSLMGFGDSVAPQTPGSVGIYQHSSVNVVRYGEHGSHDTMTTGTMREASQYLSGVIAGLRLSSK